MSISFYVFIKELGETVKTHTITIISWRWSTKVLYWWQHLEIISVLLFSKVPGAAKMVETFSNKHSSQRFELHWYCEVFSCISHDILLSRSWSFSKHVLITQLHSFIYSIWKILYGYYTMFWTPVQKFHSKQSCCWML